ncbi:MAG: NADP-dependent glyceraldehyde-3-phosphate dehydrogenase GapN [uncultured bacterium (gcode 4)]|uniref:NADP-dependent glyceraldehyde-3-phosphate dehydrogenase GapN n=1 Tax=uncultured bacterium (gcode 4) TaxID=1234023 RepID=K2GHR0_9BACT|nr:MAG: NADP-dependent glyceraldehyde-3-phosphate dehydrogenase GapN [uncultured bacterium (gcode 4)]
MHQAEKGIGQDESMVLLQTVSSEVITSKKGDVTEILEEGLDKLIEKAFSWRWFNTDSVPHTGNKIFRNYLVNWEQREFKWECQKVISPITYSDANWTLLNYELSGYPLLWEKEALEALDSAVEAYDDWNWEWPSMKPKERIRRMKEFAAQIVSNRKDIITYLMWEIGKTRDDASKEFDRTIEYILDTTDEYSALLDEDSKIEFTKWIATTKKRTPTWPTLCMGPYNYPFNETFTTLIPALLMWNTIIYKPAKFWVLFNLFLQRWFMDCFPKWAVNIIYWNWKDIITPIMRSGKIANLAFIWSDSVADSIISQHPYPHKLNSVLWLWAKNAWIVFAWCDMKDTVKQCLAGSLTFNWQRCTALKILLIQDEIFDEFQEEYLLQLSKLKFWMPYEKDVKLTPIPDQWHLVFLESLIQDAKDKWATIINECWWKRVWSYLHPAVLTGVEKWMRIYDTEQFWPIVPLVRFSDPEEVKAYIKDSKYWQQSSVFFWENTAGWKVNEMIRFLSNQVCRVNLNAQCQRSPDSLPFSGRKDSALRTLSLRDALEVFSIPMFVAADENSRVWLKAIEDFKIN